MSDIMLLGVLKMSPELWLNDALDVAQRHSRYLEAAERIERDAEKIAALEREVDAMSKQIECLLSRLPDDEQARTCKYSSCLT